MLFLQGTLGSNSQQQKKKDQGHASKAQQGSAASMPVPRPPLSTPPHTPPSPLSQPPIPPPTQRPSTIVSNQSTRPVQLSVPPQSSVTSQTTSHPHVPTSEETPSITQKALSSELFSPSLQPDSSAHKLAAAASVSKRSSSSSSAFQTSIPSLSPPKRSSPSAPRAHRPQQSSPRPSGVPVMGPAAHQPSSSAVTRQSSSLSPLKPHVSTAPKPTTRGPHTPPEQSPSRPGASPPTLLYVPTKHHPTKPANVMNNTDLPKHGQQQQQHQEPQGSEWTRQSARRKKAQHGKRVKPVSPPDSKPAQIQTTKRAPRAKPSSLKTSQVHDNQRQAESNIADLPPKAASLIEAADTRSRHTKPASWAPTSYSAAVGPASFWADVVTPLVGDQVSIAALLDRYRGSAKYEQLIKLTKGSRPFTQYRSIRGEFAHCIARRHVISVVSGLSMLLIGYCILQVCIADFGQC